MRKQYKKLTYADRKRIEQMTKENATPKQLAQETNVHIATIYRELVRRHIPKGEDFDDKTQKDVDNIAEWINNYPRKIFGYKSAEELYNEEISKVA